MNWATREQARAHWPDAASIPDATLDALLEIATTQCAAFAPAVVPNTAAATTRTNLAPNPIGPNVAVTTGLTWSGATPSVQPGFVRGTFTNSTAAQVSQFIGSPSAASGLAIPVIPGHVYTVTAQGRASTPGASMAVLLTMNDAANVAISGYSLATTACPIDPVVWKDLIAISVTAPANAATVNCRIGLFGTVPRSIGDTIDVRRLLVEDAPAPGPWFDGDTVDTPTIDYSWVPPFGTVPSATATTTPALVPLNYTLGTVYQARENYAAGQRDGDVIGLGEYAIRARPLTSTVKALLRPQVGLPVTG